MSRILEAINVVHEANAAPTEATINNLGAEIVSAASNEFDTFAEKFAEWATIASVMPDQRHGTVMIAKTKYRLQQMLQALHQSIYGNRSIEELARGERMERNSVMYCDLENSGTVTLSFRARLICPRTEPRRRKTSRTHRSVSMRLRVTFASTLGSICTAHSRRSTNSLAKRVSYTLHGTSLIAASRTRP